MTVNETRISIAERRRRVCIIGAGAGGLISCKELIDQGLEVVVYEAAECVGGTWVLRDQDGGTSTSYSSTGYGNRGLDVNQHSSMYDALHTNLPKDLMNIPGFTMGDDHTERYPHRTVVRDYLQDYCDVCGLAAHIQFNTTVTRAEYMGSSVACKDAEIHKLYYCDRQWSVHLLTNVDGVIEERVERFDAIVSANGHYSQPRLPTGSLGQQLKSHYTGSVIHSHRYRRPNGYEGKTIAVVGGGPSGRDIARDLASTATHVYLCANVPADSYLRQLANCTVYGRLCGVSEQGALVTSDGTQFSGVDVVILCTGYNYDLPYFKGTTLDRVSPTKKYLERLYLHFFDIDYPSVCHIGLPLSIVPFPLFQYQAKLAARVYAEKVQLPTLGQMVQERAAEEQIALDWAASEAQNTEVEVQDEDLVDPLNRVHHFNPPGKPHKQFDYCDAIADMCNGGPAVGVSASATDETRDKHKDACTDAAHNTPLHLHPHKGTGTGQGSALVGEDNAPTAASASPNGTNGTVSGAAPVEHTPPYFKDLFASAKEERFALLGF